MDTQKENECNWDYRKYKALLVIQDFQLKPGVDCFDIYAPVVRISTIRFFIALESVHNVIVHQMDVKKPF